MLESAYHLRDEWRQYQQRVLEKSRDALWRMDRFTWWRLQVLVKRRLGIEFIQSEW